MKDKFLITTKGWLIDMQNTKSFSGGNVGFASTIISFGIPIPKSIFSKAGNQLALASCLVVIASNKRRGLAPP